MDHLAKELVYHLFILPKRNQVLDLSKLAHDSCEKSNLT